MMPMCVHRRSTTSSTCEVRNTVMRRVATSFRSSSRSSRVATASTPSNGSSRNRSRGSWMSAHDSASFFRMPCE